MSVPSQAPELAADDDQIVLVLSELDLIGDDGLGCAYRRQLK